MGEDEMRWWDVTGTTWDLRTSETRVRGDRAYAERLVAELNAGEDPREPRMRWELAGEEGS